MRFQKLNFSTTNVTSENVVNKYVVIFSLTEDFGHIFIVFTSIFFVSL